MNSEIRKVGILTGGGDCPGINAVIRAVVRRARLDSVAVMGVKNGWQGLIKNNLELLTRQTVSGILPRGGTIIGTSRIDPLSSPEELQKIRETWEQHRLNALIVVGGEGTMSAAKRMSAEEGYPVVGVPKTIDNDLCGTDYTVGMDSAVSIVVDAIDRLHSTAESHHRVMVVEVMGRHSGWIATCGAIAGGGDVVLVPEVPFRLSEVCEVMRQRQASGRLFSIVIVSEDARPHPDEDFLKPEQREAIYHHERLGGIGPILAERIQSVTGIDARATVLGYMQRGGSPTAFDRILATRLGIKAFEMVLAGEFGRMAAITGSQMTSVTLAEAVAGIKQVDPDLYRIAEVFAG
ncbi:MAG TPA: ATP-dependent 6-phosphofructokinase [Blastocatellia bacterium]|nr:ATP-dependent 6-phosphofructokinase [Blastocatellia bacterium]